MTLTTPGAALATTKARLYVNLRGFDPDHAPVDPDDVLESLLRQLGVSAHDIPAGSAERAALFRDRMHGRDAVLILDNAADVQQVRPLISASPSCLVLITSRRSLADLEEAVWHQLGVFSEDERFGRGPGRPARGGGRVGVGAAAG